MKVLYFAHTVLNRGGDKLILSHLWYLAEKGHQICIKTSRIETLYPVHPDIKVELLRSSSRAATLAAAIREQQAADLIIATILPTACSLTLRNRNKVVFLAQEYDEQAYGNTIMRLAMIALGFIGLNWFRIPVIAVSQELASGLEHRFGVGVRVVENGIEPGVFYPDPAPEYLAMKDTGRRTILLFARSDSRKGFDLAIKVVEQLSTRLPDGFQVWLVGDHPCESIAHLPLRHFGFVTEEQLRKIFSSADVFLYPSRSDGYGLMVAEAFACKCPVVTTSAVPIAQDDLTALVCPPGDIIGLADRIISLLSDNLTRMRITEAAFRFSREHTAQIASQQFERTLLSIGY
jgi:glycosyltransferase involved in cell wall biosynthesis